MLAKGTKTDKGKAMDNVVPASVSTDADDHSQQSDSSKMAGLDKERAGAKHKMSWDEAVRAASVGSGVDAQQTVADRRYTILSWKHLHKASPFEEEAEASILKSIEEREDLSKAGSHLFAGIPDSAVESFRRAAAEEERDTNDNNTHNTDPGEGQQRSSRRQPQSLEAQLVGLTAAMRFMRANQTVDNNTEMHRQQHEEEFPTTSNSLTENASILYRRKVGKGEKGAMMSFGDSQFSLLSEIQEGDAVPSAQEEKSRDLADVECGESDEVKEMYSSQEVTGRSGWRFGPSRMWSQVKKVDRAVVSHVKEDWSIYSEFIRPQRATIFRRVARVVFFVLLPAIGIAFILYYALDNPGLGIHGASTSWFILFLTRHVLAGCLAKMLQFYLIASVTLRKPTAVRVLGPFWSLCLVQSRGFPFIISAWALFGFILLSGGNRFAKHWLFYQDAIPVFNENNPAGTLTESRMNFLVLTCALIFGIVVTIKRVLMGIHFGKKTCRVYGDELAQVIRDVLLVSQVARLAKLIEKGNYMDRIRARADALTRVAGDNALDHLDLDVSTATCQADEDTDATGRDALDQERKDRYTGSMSNSQKFEITNLIQHWEEPETSLKSDKEHISMTTVLEFRSALTLTSNEYPFSMEFGPAYDRETCIESSQKVYDGLLQLQSKGDVLDFDTIAILATNKHGEIDREKMKEFIRLFRPERDGYLSKLDFVQSVDSVYKRLRLLSASISNSGQIDRTAGDIFNWFFYTFYLVIMLSVFGLDPLALFLSLSSFIVAFAFMIGNASARYFEGLLFILARRPYNIGDRIHVSPVDEDTNPNGSNTWFVENVDLFTTTIRYATTNEVATVQNGSLAASRIINAARSPKMLVYVYMKFGVDVPFQKVMLFRETVEKFVKKRPRDWLGLTGFRATRVEVELGYIEYVMVLQHRERWQNLVPMLDAKAEFSSFALEVAKKLDMPYRAPSLPVDLNMGKREKVRDDPEADAAGDAEKDLINIMHASNQAAPDLSDLQELFIQEYES